MAQITPSPLEYLILLLPSSRPTAVPSPTSPNLHQVFTSLLASRIHAHFTSNIPQTARISNQIPIHNPKIHQTQLKSQSYVICTSLVPNPLLADPKSHPRSSRLRFRISEVSEFHKYTSIASNDLGV